MERKPQFESGGIRHGTINGHRFHLRLTDPSELNPLWIDGQSPPLLLDQVAGEFVACLIDAMWMFQQGSGNESEKVRQYVVDAMYEKYGKLLALPRYRVTRKRIQSDLDRIFGTIMGIAEGSCPVESGLAMKEISPTDWDAPARMDLALTYRCNLNCSKCYIWNGPNQQTKELSTSEWIGVLKRLWNIGIPQVVFTGGEPTLREDLVGLVGEADEFVTGLVTNGTRLVELAGPLRDASLDYMQVTLESCIPSIHNKMVGTPDGFNAFVATVEGIKKALELGMFVTTNTTLTRENFSVFPNLIIFGAELGLKVMACNTLICSGRGVPARKQNGISLDELKGILEQSVKTAQGLGVDLRWYSPTCYKQLNPIELGLGAKGCSAAAHNMLVRPDGEVLPCQSWPNPVGNIITTKWPMIWMHPTCRKLRRHGFVQDNDECGTCVHNGVCGGGCPLEMVPSLSGQEPEGEQQL